MGLSDGPVMEGQTCLPGLWGGGILSLSTFGRIFECLILENLADMPQNCSQLRLILPMSPSQPPQSPSPSVPSVPHLPKPLEPLIPHTINSFSCLSMLSSLSPVPQPSTLQVP